MKSTTQRNPKLAAALSLIPGLGQIYNGQWLKGGFFLVSFVLFIWQMLTSGLSTIQGFITLGTVAGEDHSLFLMIRGAMQIIVTILFIIYWGFIARDAYRIAQRSRAGLPVNTSLQEHINSIYQDGFPYLFIVPAYLFMIIAIIFPVFVTIATAFLNYDFKNIPPHKLLSWVGWKNFTNIYTLSTYRDAFVSVFSWTLIWTLCATTLQIVLGVFTALVAHQPFIKGKRFFGVIFLLPWAVPAFISIMTFSNMFNPSIGAINTQVIPFLKKLLPFINFQMIPWKTNVFWTKVAIIAIQGWLGFPYIYVMTTSILQSISDDLYEAATIDGATAVQKFSNITLPIILSVAAPVFLTQYTGNFNNFSMIYLFNEGGPGSVGGGAGATDILISWIFKLTTGNSPQYSVAAALTLIISVLIIVISLVIIRQTNAFSMEE